MPSDDGPDVAAQPTRQQKRAELIVFIVLAAVIWPFITVGVVGGYGFAVWMWQIIFGPPGPTG